MNSEFRMRLIAVIYVATLIFDASILHANTQVFVQPNVRWQATGVLVSPGEVLTFQATGSFSDYRGTHWFPPDGKCAVREPSNCIGGSGFLMPGVSMYSLVGKIGSGEPFFIGDYGVTAPGSGSGELYLAISDDVYGDNLGGFDVTISGGGTHDNWPPVVSITQPEHGHFFEPNEDKILAGIAVDPEEGLLPSSNYDWYSDVDGVLGTGSPLVVASMTEGRHEITLMVNDSQNQTSWDHVTIFVAPPMVTQYTDVLVVDVEMNPYVSGNSRQSPYIYKASTIKVTIRNNGITTSYGQQVRMRFYIPGNTFPIQEFQYTSPAVLDPLEQETVEFPIILLNAAVRLLEVEVWDLLDNNYSNNLVSYNIDPDWTWDQATNCFCALAGPLFGNLTKQLFNDDCVIPAIGTRNINIAGAVAAGESPLPALMTFLIELKGCMISIGLDIPSVISVALYVVSIPAAALDCGLITVAEASDLGEFIADLFWEYDNLSLSSFSPVDLHLIDPYGFETTIHDEEIAGSTYEELTLDQTNVDDIIVPRPIEGRYRVFVVPQSGADPDALVTVKARAGRYPVETLLDNVRVADLPLGWIDLEYSSGGLVPVAITGFRAELNELSVLLKWSVGGDDHSAGFNLHRAQGAGQFQVINTELITDRFEYLDTNVKTGNSYRYRLVMIDEGIEYFSKTISVDIRPGSLVLNQNHPNPFNPSTTISFTLSEKAHANLSVFGVNGKLVKTLVNDVVDEGLSEVTWDGTDARGHKVSSGVYFYRLKAGNKVLTKKMVLLK